MNSINKVVGCYPPKVRLYLSKHSFRAMINDAFDGALMTLMFLFSGSCCDFSCFREKLFPRLNDRKFWANSRAKIFAASLSTRPWGPPKFTQKKNYARLFGSVFYIDGNREKKTPLNKNINKKISVFNLNYNINYCYANEPPETRRSKWLIYVMLQSLKVQNYWLIN